MKFIRNNVIILLIIVLLNNYTTSKLVKKLLRSSSSFKNEVNPPNEEMIEIKEMSELWLDFPSYKLKTKMKDQCRRLLQVRNQVEFPVSAYHANNM